MCSTTLKAPEPHPRSQLREHGMTHLVGQRGVDMPQRTAFGIPGDTKADIPPVRLGISVGSI